MAKTVYNLGIMLDIKYIRENQAAVESATTAKGYKVNIAELLALDEQRRGLMGRIDELRAERNSVAGQMKGGKPEPELVQKGKEIKENLNKLESEFNDIDVKFTTVLKQVPNIPTDDVPIGASEDENVVAEVIGEPAEFDFTPKNHWEISQARGWIDKERAAKVTGARFAYIGGELVKLQQAIITFVINTLTDEMKIKQIINDAGLKVPTKVFKPILPPLMIRTEMYDAMDRLEPSEDRYKIDGEELWLQGSAEHVLGSMYADEIIDEADLPCRMLGFATSFRKEAGAAGKDMEGIFRMHQFDKLEMESLTTAEHSLDEHLFFVAIQKYMIEQLKLPYRVVMKCTADIGKPNARGVDMDVWLPGQDKYRETHTADYMTDYQSRRLKTRVRRENGGVELVHTNDATAFALGRIMIAVIENYQNADNTVTVPEVLRPYLNDRKEM
ncbi:MAG: serine--tRNA ligase [Candidatus Nomurabacteria bacterium]|nr:serine--tRNA ligase [Candidatus Nomurabacteria bacterium]